MMVMTLNETSVSPFLKGAPRYTKKLGGLLDVVPAYRIDIWLCHSNHALKFCFLITNVLN